MLVTIEPISNSKHVVLFEPVEYPKLLVVLIPANQVIEYFIKNKLPTPKSRYVPYQRVTWIGEGYYVIHPKIKPVTHWRIGGVNVYTHLKSGTPPLWYLSLVFDGSSISMHLPEFDPLHQLPGKKYPPLQEVESPTRFERESVI
jgi:hypothetical protein